jgi:protein-tyrosine phosphatase
MDGNRVLELEGVHNFRDYGGYAVTGGGRVRRGLLWRSGQHFGATDADLGRIAALNLTSFFDLRTSRERASHPCRRLTGFSGEVYFSDDPTRERAPHLAAARAITPQRDIASMRENMRQNYANIAFRPELIFMMRLYLAHLAQGKGASLVNCMAGKDRTGIAVAMVQMALMVHRDDVIADYLLTNSVGNVGARIAAGAETIRAFAGEMDPDVVRVLMGVEAEYLERTFDAINDRHGSIDIYLSEVLGVDAAMKAQLVRQLVEF